jgi:fused signal recognition particle receptor
VPPVPLPPKLGEPALEPLPEPPVVVPSEVPLPVLPVPEPPVGVPSVVPPVAVPEPEPPVAAPSAVPLPVPLPLAAVPSDVATGSLKPTDVLSPS